MLTVIYGIIFVSPSSSTVPAFVGVQNAYQMDKRSAREWMESSISYKFKWNVTQAVT